MYDIFANRSSKITLRKRFNLYLCHVQMLLLYDPQAIMLSDEEIIPFLY